MTEKIQMVDLKRQYCRLKNEIDLAMQTVVESGAFINGPQVKQFADELSRFLACKAVIPCANGTDALQIAMMTCGFKPGDEVIVPAFTYVATVEVIALLGLKPVFIDVNKHDFNLDVLHLQKKLTKKTVGIVAVHLYGQCANMEEINLFAKHHNLLVIEDTAQAIGAEYTFKNGSSSYAGTLGDIGTTSFFPSKNLGCFGDGGAILTNNKPLGVKAKMIANHGQSKKYIHDEVGVNSRLDTLQAALLIVKLKELMNFTERRRKVAYAYDTELSKIQDIIIPHRNINSTHVFHQYTIQVRNGKRDELKLFLEELGIPSMIYYPIPVHLQKAYSTYGYKAGDFPVSESLCEKVLSLPIHTEMTEEVQEYIIENIKAYFN